MREIKFRAYDIQEDDLIYGILPLSDGTFLMENASSDKYVDVYPEMDTTTPNNFVLMQYTGLKDKDGKEIYEGDILYHKYTYSPEMSFAVYDRDETFVVKIPDFFLKLGVDIGNSDEDLQEFVSYMEIKGNIYRNPELLEVE